MTDRQLEDDGELEVPLDIGGAKGLNLLLGIRSNPLS